MTYQFYCQKLQQTLTYCSTVQKGKLYFADEVNFAELAGGVIFLLTQFDPKNTFKNDRIAIDNCKQENCIERTELSLKLKRQLATAP